MKVCMFLFVCEPKCVRAWMHDCVFVHACVYVSVSLFVLFGCFSFVCVCVCVCVCV